jgi:hypothetical protein
MAARSRSIRGRQGAVALTSARGGLGGVASSSLWSPSSPSFMWFRRSSRRGQPLPGLSGCLRCPRSGHGIGARRLRLRVAGAIVSAVALRRRAPTFPAPSARSIGGKRQSDEWLSSSRNPSLARWRQRGHRPRRQCNFDNARPMAKCSRIAFRIRHRGSKSPNIQAFEHN